MRRVALIPVKRLSRSKTRLGRRLETVERAGLSISTLTGVAKACMDAGLRPILLSPDPTVMAIARQQGWGYIRDRGRSLRSSVAASMRLLSRGGVSGVLIAHADLPLLTKDDIKQIIAISRDADMIICPNITMDGTNIVYVRKPKDFRPMYGKGSFRRHLRYHTASGLRVKTFISLGSALDLDTPKDLRLLSRLGPSSKLPNA